jgi:HlyD family secretion protein
MRHWLCIMIVAGLFLSACGTNTAQVEPPTPTPLPPDPALERPTYPVVSGPIERAIEVTARATPIDLERLSFKIDGRVETVFFKRGDIVKAGDIIAELQQGEALDDLRRAQDDLVQAKRDLEEARKTQSKTIRERELDLKQAQESLNRLLPGGDADVLRDAQQKLEDAKREAANARNDRSWAKTGAEDTLRSRAEALQDAQKSYSTAKWNFDWAKRYNTHPTEKVPSANDPNVLVPRKLVEGELEKFEESLIQAERSLRAAERSLEEAQRSLDKAREDETVENTKGDQKVTEAQQVVDKLLAGKDSKEVSDARRAVENANLALEEARNKTLNSETRAVENAQRTLDRAQKKVDDGRISAPRDGTIIAITLETGASVTAFEAVAEVADVSKVEFAATLNGEQMRQLVEGQPAELRLLTRPDVAIPVVIRRMPAPYGSGGSGAIQDRDQTTRFEVPDAQGQEIKAGATLGKIRIVLERKPSALLLPPEAIRSFEGRRFVIVREGERERRITVRVGITTETQVEILDGLEEGDIVVGP